MKAERAPLAITLDAGDFIALSGIMRRLNFNPSGIRRAFDALTEMRSPPTGGASDRDPPPPLQRMPGLGDLIRRHSTCLDPFRMMRRLPA